MPHVMIKPASGQVGTLIIFPRQSFRTASPEGCGPRSGASAAEPSAWSPAC